MCLPHTFNPSIVPDGGVTVSSMPSRPGRRDQAALRGVFLARVTTATTACCCAPVSPVNQVSNCASASSNGSGSGQELCNIHRLDILRFFVVILVPPVGCDRVWPHKLVDPAAFNPEIGLGAPLVEARLRGTVPGLAAGAGRL
jgi:hypothetical protein